MTFKQALLLKIAQEIRSYEEDQRNGYEVENQLDTLWKFYRQSVQALEIMRSPLLWERN